MMHAEQKSDAAIVSAKAANKEEQSSAEPPEEKGRKQEKSARPRHGLHPGVGPRVTRSRAGTAICQGEPRGETHRALTPHRP